LFKNEIDDGRSGENFKKKKFSLPSKCIKDTLPPAMTGGKNGMNGSGSWFEKMYRTNNEAKNSNSPKQKPDSNSLGKDFKKQIENN
jgi:hypothetical protein